MDLLNLERLAKRVT